MKLLNKGKVKEVYEVSDTELEFLFTDNISVFDQIIPSRIPRKGEVLCRCAEFWFRQIEDIVKTDLIKVILPNKMRVRRVNIIRDYGKINNKTTNYLIPLEFVLRWYNAGSLYANMTGGKIKPEAAGFEKGHKPVYGEPLPEPLFEQTTKLEPIDRKLTIDEALKISGLTMDELNNIKEICIKIDEKMDREVRKRGLMHADGKKEFGMNENREIMILDTFGTPDEDRFWDATEYDKGNIVEFSKEFVRKYYEKISHKKKLDEAREKGLPEPKIPPLPEDMIKKTSELYVDLFGKITGGKF
jgi:phosphoribosylaminoimidazole-succinocarboxamide synthase